MGFGEAIRICLRKYVDFQGRARRAEYWWFVLFTLLVGIAAGTLDLMFARNADTGPIEAIASLALFLPSLAVSARRLHDIDRTAWWLLFFCGGFFALGVCIGLIGFAPAAGGAAVSLVALVLIASIMWFLVWSIAKGTPGPNRFGPDPLTGNVTSMPSPAPAV